MSGRRKPYVSRLAEDQPNLRSRQALEALLSEHLKRRESDPLRLFVPFDIQKQFINSALYGHYQENFYLGANRSGKTDAGCYIAAQLARFGYPDDSPLCPGWGTARGSNVSVRDRATSGWVSALDYPMARDIIQPKLFNNGYVPAGATHAPFIPEYEIEDWRPTDQILKLRNGSIIGFKSADSGRAKYQGAEKDWVMMDEEHPEDIYNEIIIRVGARKLNIFTAATLLPPVGMAGGITWLFSKVIQPWKMRQTGKKYGIFNASIYDNPFIPDAEKDRLEARYPPDSVQGRIRLRGELIPGLAGARIYSSFDRAINVPQNMPELSPHRPLIWTWDFNVEPMVTLVGQYDRPYFRVYSEIMLEEGNISEMCDAFRREYPYHYAEVIVHGDASGHSRSQQTRRSSYSMVLNCMAAYPAPLRLRVPFANPSVDTRVQAVNRCCKNEDGERLLQISSKCEELITDLEQVVGDGRSGIKKVTNRKDPYYRRTHMSDALGYWIAYAAPVVTLSNAREGIRIPRPAYQG